MTIVPTADRLSEALEAFIAEAMASPESYSPEQLQEIVGVAARLKASLAHGAKHVAENPKEHIAKVGAIAAQIAVDHLVAGGGSDKVVGFGHEEAHHLGTCMYHHAVHYAHKLRQTVSGGQQAA